ncbi:MAG: trigger factor [Planctomycetes bacterium]|nr:trigger factor [Planctomycetota bacterium]MBU1518626.1 trigger factor [Planctomycetota bacterium]MBU2457708.1 trigger factor [Planctomycetota bacterium]MBU2596773.1 trigger factor [Planctomycetota bacterium]
MAKEKQANEPQAETKDEIKNIVKITDAGPCKKKISVEIPAETIAKAFDGQYEDLRKNALVPGFRKGRAPRRLLEKRFGKESSLQVKLKLLADASEAALKDNNVESLGEPDIDHEKIELPATGPMKFEFEIEVRPDIKLPELEGIPVAKPKLEVTDADVEKEIAELQKRLGTWKPKDGKIAAADQIIADVTLKCDGQTEKMANTEIHIHHRGFVGKVVVDDLDKLLVGAKTGDVKTTTTDVPSSFHEEQYRGKKVDVEIKISDVKELVPAELNEAFFKRIGVPNADDLKANIRQRGERDLERQQRDAIRQEVRQYLLGKVDFDLPEDVVADQSRSILQRQYTRMLLQGAKAEEIQKQMEQLKAASQQQAEESLRSYFIMDTVAKKFDIKATDEEINGYIAQAAMYRQVRPEKLREQMSRDGSLVEAALEIREIKCIDKILETAKISEVAPEKIAAKHKKAEAKPAKKEAPKREAEKKTEKAEKPAPKKETTKKEEKPTRGERGRTEPKKESKATPKKTAPKKKGK